VFVGVEDDDRRPDDREAVDNATFVEAGRRGCDETDNENDEEDMALANVRGEEGEREVQSVPPVFVGIRRELT
jgi:hypothetical protein